MSETWLTRHAWCTRQSWRSPTGMSFWPAGRMTMAPRVIVIHSTETVGFPGYRNGADAPHFTIDLPSGLVRQHVPLEWGSRCLAVSTGGVTDRTVNVSGTIQIEVIGAVTPGYPKTFGHYDLPNRFPNDQAAQQHMARLIRAIHDAVGQKIPLQLSSLATWIPYPQSYGVHARQRLSSAAFLSARGIVGHQHAPANSHGDGVLGRAIRGRAPDLESVVFLARGTAPAPPPTDVTAPAGSTWEVTAEVLNCRFGPGTQHQVVGTAPKGLVITATGRVSGQWIEAQTPWQIDNNVRAWWHSGFLARTTPVAPPKPDPTVLAAQEHLVALGYTVGDDGPDGFHGPDTTVAIASYTAAYGYRGGPTDHRALLAHLEETMTNILTEIAALRKEVRGLPDAIMGHPLYKAVFHYYVRGGLILDPDHRHFPADPGSDADKRLRAEAAENEGRVRLYLPSRNEEVALVLNEETNRFEIKEN